MTAPRQSGFTLIELSIVLIIIGLIVGGILTGRDLIRAAESRALLSQFEKYDAAVNAFKLKFNCLPGDCAQAADYGFIARVGGVGGGDGNGLVQGCPATYAIGYGCESVVFWRDLSEANLINSKLTTATFTAYGTLTEGTSPGIADYFPQTVSGVTDYVKLLHCQNGVLALCGGSSAYLVTGHYYVIAGTSSVTWNGTSESSVPKLKLPIYTAYYIDNKVDDALPTTGRVQEFQLDASWLLQLTLGCHRTISGVIVYATMGGVTQSTNCSLAVKAGF